MPGDDKFHLNSPARFYANVSKGVGGGGGRGVGRSSVMAIIGKTGETMGASL